MRRAIIPRIALWALVSCVLASTLCAPPAKGQVVKGSISGSLIDQTGAAVPGASIEVMDAATGAVSKTVSDATGLFRFSLLGVGSYTLSVSKEGFRRLTLSAVQVSSAQDNNLGALQLEVGQLTTTVEVSAAPPLVSSVQSQISSSITSTTLQVFPGLSGNEGLDSVVLQLPGVVNTRDNQFSNTNGVGFSSNGLRGRSNDQQIDGQNNNDNSVTGPQIFVGNSDWVQEYQVTTSNFGPEYNRNSGSVVNILTKSGTNSFHGNAFITENSWKTQTLTNTQKAFEGLTQVPKFNDEFSGVSVGGPIIRDKLFFFTGFDDQIIPGTTNYSTGNKTPTPAGLQQLATCFPGSDSVKVLQQYGPFGVTGGNPVISGTPSTATLTDPNGNPCPVEVAGVQRTLATPYHQYDFLARMDWNHGDKDRVYGRFLRQTQDPANADSFGRAAVGYPVSVPSFGIDIGLDWTRSISATMMNEARLSYGRSTVQFGGNTIGNTIPPITAIDKGLASIGMPSGYASFGPLSSSPQGRIVNTYQFQDNWSWVRGKHQIKAGANLTYQRSPNVFLPNYNGTFSYSTFQNFALNIPRTVSITLGSPNLDFREHDDFFYVGDDWKIKPNLTLNLGLSYAYFGQPANLFHEHDLARESGSNPFFDPTLPLSVRTFPQLPSVKTNFAPTVGFAYSPKWGGWLTGGNKLVIRGGYRLTFDPAYYNIYLNIASAAPQVLAQTLSGATAAENGVIAQPFGPAVRDQLAPFLTLGVQDPRNFNQTTVSPNFRNDRVQMWSFGIQRELTPHAALEARYVGNHGSNLFQSINGNSYVAGLADAFPSLLPSGITPCSEASAVVANAVGRVDCNLGVVRERTNTAVSDYHGLQTQFRATNLANQLTLTTAYTWSKTTDNASEIFGNALGAQATAFSQNSLDYVHGEHGLSVLDIPQNWTLQFYEQIPAFKDQHGWKGRILGGWALSGSYIIASGQAYTPVQQFLNAGTGGGVWDAAFLGAFNNGLTETARPFVSNPKAPLTNVGMYAGDACAYFGSACEMPTSTLLNFNSLNSTGVVATATGSSVRYIVNGVTSDTIYGTPWGSAGRNTLRDYHTNTANFNIVKDTKVSERVNVRFTTTFINVFNHPNFGGIVNYYGVDPFVDNAGILQEEYGFGVPSLFSGGARNIKFQLKIIF